MCINDSKIVFHHEVFHLYKMVDVLHFLDKNNSYKIDLFCKQNFYKLIWQILILHIFKTY